LDLPIASLSGNDETVTNARSNRQTQMKQALESIQVVEDADITRRVYMGDPNTRPSVPEPSGPSWPNWWTGPHGVHWTAGGWRYEHGIWLAPIDGWSDGRRRRGVTWVHDRPTKPPPMARGNWCWDHRSNDWR
jgi:hypothetical protein